MAIEVRRQAIHQQLLQLEAQHQVEGEEDCSLFSSAEYRAQKEASAPSLYSPPFFCLFLLWAWFIFFMRYFLLFVFMRYLYLSWLGLFKGLDRLSWCWC